MLSKPQTRFFEVEVDFVNAPGCRFFVAAKEGSSCSASKITRPNVTRWRTQRKPHFQARATSGVPVPVFMLSQQDHEIQSYTVTGRAKAVFSEDHLAGYLSFPMGPFLAPRALWLACGVHLICDKSEDGSALMDGPKISLGTSVNGDFKQQRRPAFPTQILFVLCLQTVPAVRSRRNFLAQIETAFCRQFRPCF